MIHVTRDGTNRPEGFQGRSDQWLKMFQEEKEKEKEKVEGKKEKKLTAAAFWASVREEIRPDAAALAEVFRGKCAFCESMMAHVQHPPVEHYRPKSRAEFENLIFDWENWLLSCGRCNTTKSTNFPLCDGGIPCLIDPTTEDPTKHLDFALNVIGGKTKRGWETIRLAGLRREALETQRSIWLTKVDVLLLLTRDAGTRQEARDLLVWCANSEAPWTACVRAYLGVLAPKLLSAPPVSIGGDPVQRIRDLVEKHKADFAQLE